MSLNIYIVDDYRPMASTLAKLFEILGHKADFETSAEKAKQCCSKPEQVKNYDYILLDIFLNGINGIDIYKELKSIGMAHKVVFVSGCDSQDDTFKQALITGQPVIMKKFNPKEMILALQSGKIQDWAKTTHAPSVQLEAAK